MTRITTARSFALLLTMTLVVAACGTTAETASPTPSPSPAPTATSAPSPSSASPSSSPSGTPVPDAEAAAIYDAIEDQVVAMRGLEPTTVERQTIDAEALKTMTRESFEKDNPPEYVAANDRLLKAFGLIDEDASLKELYLDLVGSSVAGFYRPEEKTLYVVSRTDRINGSDKITFAHEYTHALQDANFPGVFAEQEELRDQSDRALARAALYEGDATLLMSLWAVPNLSPEDIQDVLAAGADPESAAVMARTPEILTQTLLFPYNNGLQFTNVTYQADDWAGVDEMYANLPESTEQVLHPDKYAAGEAPIEVALPEDLATAMGDGWSVKLEDTFGEYQMQVWLQSLGDQDDRASGGWGGDRLTLLEGPDGAWAVAWHTVWDTAADAREFETGATAALKSAGGPAGVLPGEGATHRWVLIGSDDDAFGRVADALGLAG